jgi:hypothetical protein
MPPLGSNVLNHFEGSMRTEHYSFTLPYRNGHGHVAKGLQ